jgi:hypothetical protein
MWYATLQNLVKIPVIILGLIMVPVMWFFRDVPHADVSKALLLWCNPEDWYGGYRKLPLEYNCVPDDTYDGNHGFWYYFRYHALRNGGDGLRNYKWHTCRYVHESMHLVREDKDGYRIQQGKYGSMGKQVGKFYLKYGYRQTPKDVREGYDPDSIRWNHGAGPAWSFRKNN